MAQSFEAPTLNKITFENLYASLLTMPDKELDECTVLDDFVDHLVENLIFINKNPDERDYDLRRVMKILYLTGVENKEQMAYLIKLRILSWIRGMRRNVEFKVCKMKADIVFGVDKLIVGPIRVCGDADDIFEA